MKSFTEIFNIHKAFGSKEEIKKVEEQMEAEDAIKLKVHDLETILDEMGELERPEDLGSIELTPQEGSVEDPRLMEDRIDWENVSSGEDEYAQFDNMTLEDMRDDSSYIEKNQQLIADAEESSDSPFYTGRVEKKPLPMSTQTFGLAREAKKYAVLREQVAEVSRLAPKRGPNNLTIKQIEQEILQFNKLKDKSSASLAEKEFIKQCELYLMLNNAIQGINLKKPEFVRITKEGAEERKELTGSEINSLVAQYDRLKEEDPQAFAIMLLEVYGNKQVAEGKWGKTWFAWNKHEFKNHLGEKEVRWFCNRQVEVEYQKGKEIIKKKRVQRYVSLKDPKSVAGEGEVADFFYTIDKQVKDPGKVRQVFIDLKLPGEKFIHQEKASEELVETKEGDKKLQTIK